MDDSRVRRMRAVQGEREKDLALLRRALEGSLSDEQRSAFEKMLEGLTEVTAQRCGLAPDKYKYDALTDKQRKWVAGVVGEPVYENLASARGLTTKIETIPMLRKENLPMKPPGRP